MSTTTKENDMAESKTLRIVMAPKTNRVVALGLAVESYGSYEVEGPDVKPSDHTANVLARAQRFLDFLDAEGSR